jgi:D-glycero-alpha-D-manno-heptose-7-phosphate kinase
MYVNLIGDPLYSKDAISAAIDKYVYVAINPTPLVNHVSARYSVTENVPIATDLKNERVRETLIKFGVNSNIEIGSFASFPMEVGFKSFLSFTTALTCGLHSHRDKGVDPKLLAKEVFEIEKRAISKNYSIQGAHSAAGGGINIYTFKDNGDYSVKPIFVDFHERLKFENLLNIYFFKVNNRENKTTRYRRNTNGSAESATTAMVNQFKKALVNGDVEECAFILHKSWMLEQNIGFSCPPKIATEAYEKAIAVGALGGKYVGDQNSGCLILISNAKVLKVLDVFLEQKSGIQFSKFKICFVQSGARTIFKLNHE